MQANQVGKAYIEAKQEAAQHYQQQFLEKQHQINHILTVLQKPMIMLDHQVEHETISTRIWLSTRFKLETALHLLRKAVRSHTG